MCVCVWDVCVRYYFIMKTMRRFIPTKWQHAFIPTQWAARTNLDGLLWCASA